MKIATYIGDERWEMNTDVYIYVANGAQHVVSVQREDSRRRVSLQVGNSGNLNETKFFLGSY